MFSAAFKSFTSNITASYEISKQPRTSAGVWQIFDAKKKSSGSAVSIFVFDRKSLDVQSNGLGARTSATSIRKAQEHVIERLKKGASNLARLRHPSILQLVEPVEETRNGGLLFATEPVIAALSTALADKDAQERTSGTNGRSSRSVSELADNGSHAGDLELDELEIQKGLLQVAKGLEFLHDSAKLVHGNINPGAIFINAKSDWKISGLAFAGPPDGMESSQSTPQIALSEALHEDARIPKSVQLDLDYTSPDLAIDSNITGSTDMYSLGLLILAVYNTPHKSPIETHGSLSTYKRLFTSSATTPVSSNNFLCSKPLPNELTQTLPKLLGRRPAQRHSAAEFQQSQYFNNILVNTLRFLDALAAKSQNEKVQFMRGLGRVMPQFPASVLEKKVLTALLEEMKDKELLPLILQNTFAIIKMIPSGRSAFSEKVLPRFREVFLTKSKSEEKDTSKDAALLVIIENLSLISEKCNATDFKEEVLPIVHLAMESPTHSLVDSALQSLPAILPQLDFSTVKHDLFPVVASVFGKTSSLSIKVRGLEALYVLCGGARTSATSMEDDFPGVTPAKSREKTTSSLDKFTMQEKVVPLLKVIKTKEPAVMIAALNVFERVGKEADADFVALEIMPLLWTFSLGPLLNLSQFKRFMDLIKTLSERVEREQSRKLQGLSSANTRAETSSVNMLPALANGSSKQRHTGADDDFENLVIGDKRPKESDAFDGALAGGQKLTQNPPTFSWSTNTNTGASQSPMLAMPSLRPQPASRSITPDVSLHSYPSLQPSASLRQSTWQVPLSTTSGQIPPQYNMGLSTQASSQRPSQSSNSHYTAPPLSNNGILQPLKPSSASAPSWSQTGRVVQPMSASPSNAVSFTPTIAPPPSSRPQAQVNMWQSQPASHSGVQQPQLPFQQVAPSSVTSPQVPAGQQKTGLNKYQSLL